MKQKSNGKAGRRGREPRHSGASRNNRIVLTAFCWALVLIMLGLGIYTALWYFNLGRIQRDSDRYAGLYGGRQTDATTGSLSVELDLTPLPADDAPAAVPTTEPAGEPVPAPTATPTVIPTVEPTEAPTAVPAAEISEAPTAAPTLEPTSVPTPQPASAPATKSTERLTSIPSSEPTLVFTAKPATVPTAEPTVVPTAGPTAVLTAEPTAVLTAEPTVVPTATPTPGPTPAPFGADMPVAVDVPIPTPGSDTLVYALPTAPPIQQSFDALLALNPETVGFLEIEGMIALPVAQRENDNEYYLSHTFEGMESSEGALFLDGMNRLVPEDDCLIVYGHNMKNKTMFGKLSAYEDIVYLRHHSVIRFDTLYENRRYVIFAGFVASMKPGDARYFDVRHFIFDDVEFDKFVLKLQSRSMFKSPIEVEYGDRLLLLVTCDYTRNEGRLILALRQLRPDENENDVWATAMRTEMK